MITLTVQFTAPKSATFLAPSGLAVPHVSPVEVDCDGATLRFVRAPNVSQWLLAGSVEHGDVTLRYRFAPGGPAYPEALFQPTGSRYARVAGELAEEMGALAARAGGGLQGLEAIVAHVAGLFDYGHPEERFYDGHDAIPQICGTTKGSCVDINAYLIAALRSAGYEAGYVYGPFIPADKKTWCTDMHCWVVTRFAGTRQEWDVAHHLKMGTRSVRAGLNPKPGVRVALSHSMGWDVPAMGLTDIKLFGPPVIVDEHALSDPAEMSIAFDGYDQIATADTASELVPT